MSIGSSATPNSQLSQKFSADIWFVYVYLLSWYFIDPMDIFQNFQMGYHYLIVDQKLTTQENQKFTKGSTIT